MKALLFCIGYRAALEPLVNFRPSPLLRFADKPIIFHIIEALADQGIKEIDCILHHFPEQIEQELGNGKRWGIEIRYHLVKDPLHPFSMVKTAARRHKNSLVLVGQGDLLPKLPQPLNTEKNQAAFFYDETEWTGWGVVDAHAFEHLPTDCTVDLLPTHISEHEKVPAAPFLSGRSLRSLVNGNEKQISKSKPEILFPTTASQVEPGIWISRGAVIEPGATITAPIFIGVESHISTGAVIGPNTVIEALAFIGSHSHVQNSLICQRSYVGEHLEIDRCIVDRNSLINLEHQSVVGIQDPFILSDTSPPSFGKTICSWIERGLALLILIVLSPVFFALWITGEKKEEKKLAAPSPKNKKKWKTTALTSFTPNSRIRKFFRRLPFLWQIVLGNLHFVGISPRAPQEVEQMPQEWQQIYLHSKIGLITLDQLDFGKQATMDEHYASDAYYVVHMGFFFDCKLFFRWLFKAF